MSTESLDEAYFVWLYRQVAPVRIKNPARTHWSLLRHFFHREFTWFVPNDDNRAEDGKNLRRRFVEEEGFDPPQEWFEMNCSVLEMLVALSERLSFSSERASLEWFWHLVENLGLRGFNDAYFDDANYDPRDLVDAVIDKLLDRTYDEDGNGGLFPLKETKIDQRKAEIWYQMNYYLLEMERG